MTLGVKIVDDAMLQVSVKDDGEGIAPENMTRIFAHGFTTRKEGHGFGLGQGDPDAKWIAADVRAVVRDDPAVAAFGPGQQFQAPRGIAVLFSSM